MGPTSTMSISRVTLSLSSRCHGHSQESQDIQSFPRKQKQKQTALLHKEGTGRALPGTRAGAQCVRATPSLPPLHRWRFHGEFSKRLLKRSFEPHSNCVRGAATLSVRRRRCFAAGPGWRRGGGPKRARPSGPLQTWERVPAGGSTRGFSGCCPGWRVSNMPRGRTMACSGRADPRVETRVNPSPFRGLPSSRADHGNTLLLVFRIPAERQPRVLHAERL